MSLPLQAVPAFCVEHALVGGARDRRAPLHLADHDQIVLGVIGRAVPFGAAGRARAEADGLAGLETLVGVEHRVTGSW